MNEKRNHSLKIIVIIAILACTITGWLFWKQQTNHLDAQDESQQDDSIQPDDVVLNLPVDENALLPKEFLNTDEAYFTKEQMLSLIKVANLDKTTLSFKSESHSEKEYAYRSKHIHDSILADLEERRVLTIHKIDLANPKAVANVRKSIFSALLNNKTNNYSDNFIIKMDADLYQFRNFLNAIHIEDFYEIIMLKNRKLYGNQAGKLPGKWKLDTWFRSDAFDGIQNDQTANQEELSKGHSCEHLPENTIDYLSPNLSILVEQNRNQPISTTLKLVWFSPQKASAPRLTFDLLIDKNYLYGVNDLYKQAALDNHIIEKVRKYYLISDSINDPEIVPIDNIITFESFFNGSIFYIVDGRFIADFDGHYNFILAYHSFNLNAVKDACHFNDSL